MEEYFSDSTIDNPPREPKEPEQEEMFPVEEEDSEDGPKWERKFEVEFSVALKPAGGKPIRVPLYTGSCGGTEVMKRMELAMASRRNRRIIDAVLDNPEHKEPKEEEPVTPVETPEPEEPRELPRPIDVAITPERPGRRPPRIRRAKAVQRADSETMDVEELPEMEFSEAI